MRRAFLNLNEPALDDGIVRHVLLQKDNKPICRASYSNLPFDPPAFWSISKFRPSTIYWQMDLPQCQLYPEPENGHQRKEWGIFLRFLWKNSMVAVVKSECCDFYIVAPDEFPEFSHAIVLYQMQKGSQTSHKGMRTTGLRQSEHKSSVRPDNLIQRSYKNWNSQPINQASNDFSSPRRFPGSAGIIDEQVSNSCCEEVTDETEGGKKRIVEKLKAKVFTHVGNNPCDLQLPWTTADPIFRTSSIDDSPHKSLPVRSPEDVHKNFVRTDPSYLRTLSQTHAGWIFGAIAELVDNSRDANSKRLDISIGYLYSKKEADSIPVLSFVDDGHGMHHADIMRMLSFGHKVPSEEDPDRVGRFGIGFKTGAMKLGRDVLVLTQTSTSRSVALLSESFNENKENLEIPIVTYCKRGRYMEVDLDIQLETTTEYHLKAIKEFSPFNEYLIGEKLGLFGEFGTGTQIYIWNLDKWGSDYSLQWDTAETPDSARPRASGDIWIRSRRVRSRPGQITQKVPLDYSLQAYLEVIFLNPQTKIYVQGSLVKSRPLAETLNKTVEVKGHVMGKALHLTLGQSHVEWERMNCGIFLYWHGRLIEAYKHVGGMIHNADMGRGVLGVVDVTNLMDSSNGQVWVLNNKQGFQDCEAYARLEHWLGEKADQFWDENFDNIDLRKGNAQYKTDHEWVQCNKCRKWRMLSSGFDVGSLPPEWFCYMPPFDGQCEIPEQQISHGVITISAKRSGYDSEISKKSESGMPLKVVRIHEDESGENSAESPDEISRPALKRIRKEPRRSCKQSS